MTFEIIRNIFAWCLVMNFGLLLLWLVMFLFAHDWIYKMHSKWYKITPDSFNAINYGGLGIYKMIVIVFNLFPYIAMHIVR